MALLAPLKRLVPEDSQLRRIWRIARRRSPLPAGAGPLLLSAFARDHPSACFIQIGSNDGEHLDPLRSAIVGHAWRGVMVEPVPYVFDRLRANYEAHADRIALENAAIADQDGLLPFFHLKEADDYEAEGLPQWYDALGSFRKDVLLTHAYAIPDIEERIIRRDVPCLTFDSLCRKHDVHHLDLLHLDTEGYDFHILQTVDFDTYRPRLVIFERHHMTVDERAESNAFMRDRGYDMVEEGLDTWCVNERDTASVDRHFMRTWRWVKRAAAERSS